MAKNELVLVDQVIEERQKARAVPLDIGDAFELFGCELAVRERDLTPEEIEAGIVGGGNDGAIDGVYTFLGDTLLAEDSEIFDDDFAPSSIRPKPRLFCGWSRLSTRSPSQRRQSTSSATQPSDFSIWLRTKLTFGSSIATQSSTGQDCFAPPCESLPLGILRSRFASLTCPEEMSRKPTTKC